MRPDALPEIKISNDFSRCDIDNHHVAAVSSRLANAGVPVNRDVCQLSITRTCDFMPGHSAFGDLRYLFSRNRVEGAQAVVPFACNQQQALPARPASGLGPREENEG